MKKVDTHCYTVQWHDGAKKYIARVVGFPWAHVFGDTPETALMAIRRKVAEVESLMEGEDADTRTKKGHEKEE